MKNSAGVFWRENKMLLLVMFGFVVLGLAIGAFVVFDPYFHHFRITPELLDNNITNVLAPSRGIFAFIMARLMEFSFGLLLVFIFNLSRFSFWLTFPYIAFRAFWKVINLFWIVDRFGFTHGSVFFLVYLILFLFMLFLFIVSALFLIKRCAQIRKYGFRVGCRWHEVRRPCFYIIVGILAVGVLEWLMYFLVLSRLVYVF